MDMYQKRKMRSENKTKEEKINQASINWYIPPYGKLLLNLYK